MENRVFLRLCCQREAFWYNVAWFFFFKVLCLLWFYFFDWSGLTSLTLNTKLFWSTVTWEQLSWIRQKLLHPVSDKAVKWMVLTCALQKDKYMKTSKVPLHPQSHLWSRGILNKRRKLSLCGILHGIPFFWQWPGSPGVPRSPQHLPAGIAPWGGDFHCKPMPWLWTCPLQLHWCPFLSYRMSSCTSKPTTAVDVHSQSLCHSWFYRSPFHPPDNSFSSNQMGSLLNNWYSSSGGGGGIGKWHWPNLAPCSNCFLSKNRPLIKGNTFLFSMFYFWHHMWTPEYKSHFSLSRFQDVSQFALWPMFLSHHLDLWVKK